MVEFWKINNSRYKCIEAKLDTEEPLCHGLNYHCCWTQGTLQACVFFHLYFCDLKDCIKKKKVYISGFSSPAKWTCLKHIKWTVRYFLCYMSTFHPRRGWGKGRNTNLKKFDPEYNVCWCRQDQPMHQFNAIKVC